ncbi:MAG: hypothetical protein JO370_03685 [Paucibacter sp.]|nr:hypothetical protein [Roseateles sp.]
MTVLAWTLTLHPDFSQAQDSLPPQPQYKGEFKRDSHGDITIAPAAEKSAGDELGPQGRVIRVGPTHRFQTIAGAAAAARSGDVVEIEAGDYAGDVAVWDQYKLTIRAVGGRARLTAQGKSAEDKAIWVIRGGDFKIENIEFNGARSSSKNGAGIRLERGKLSVRRCAFFNNEDGILTGDNAGALEILDSEFGFNGAGDGLSHAIYTGHIPRLTVTGSYFHHAREGHLIKSRAAESRIYYNRITDEPGGRASYEIDLPNGGLAYVVGNIAQQSAGSTNGHLISFGVEGYVGKTHQLFLSFNTLVNSLPGRGEFLLIKPGKFKLYAANNVLVGVGGIDLAGQKTALQTPWHGNDRLGEFLAEDNAQALLLNNNVLLHGQDFSDAGAFDFRPRPSPRAPLGVANLEPGDDMPVVPEREYVHPAHSRPLLGKPTLPGAFQLSGDTPPSGRAVPAATAPSAPGSP